MSKCGVLIFVGVLLIVGGNAVVADESLALRVSNMLVAPAHMPAVNVWVKNRSQEDFKGPVTVELPQGWRLDPPSQEVMLAPGETGSARFTVHDAKTREDNRYNVTAVAGQGAKEIRHSQEIVCASAPYFKPEIDRNADDWKDAIPVTFVAGGKKTTISTFWNRRQFSMLVAVEEAKLVVPGNGQPCDAVQIAISPADTATSTSADGVATRYEFLLAADETGQGGHCFQLAEPGTRLSETQGSRDLAELKLQDPDLAVWREGDTTYYEWAVSFRTLKEIKPSEGREFFLSVLVHDPDGTGLRDWGEATGLWPSQRNRLAWSNWPGAAWPEKPPMDNKTEWGMCSSKF